ncbi:hypothetical protein DSL92_00705 [Billgrantia gudaonensis]|uniref:Uncharacterized protein n=1 Tax=Billgrantia gudaonensis TaxID=376427 RepID=A0A432JKQ0_9GAMM|nr:hypothetical protein DSL92_00705 [Halomonas gudaonensis]
MTAREWLEQLLGIMAQKEASDLLISVQAPPTMKIAGQLIALGEQRLRRSGARAGGGAARRSPFPGRS